MYDIVIIGGGIVGLATGLTLQARFPTLRLCVVEKEEAVGRHQTGHNSGVIHSGVYYRPGSLKARLCVEGARRLEAFCQAHAIPHERVGKLIVAVQQHELPALAELHRRAVANGVPEVRLVGPVELREIEPHVDGLSGLHLPGTGIVDYGRVAAAMAEDLMRNGADVRTGARVVGIRPDTVETTGGDIPYRFLINCAGLHSDRIAAMAGCRPEVQIVPFRGEYYFLKPERRNLVRGLIYPVPDTRMPFLGVHFTRTIDGDVEAGPNAVLALAREGYSWSRLQPVDLAGTLTYGGFWRLAGRFWRTGMYEMYRSLSRREFVRSLQRLVPAVTGSDVSPGGAGVRAQAVSRDGRLVDDFVIQTEGRSIHVLNAPSPAATASLAIGGHVASLAAETWRLSWQ